MADIDIACTDVLRTGINVTDNDTAVTSGNTYYIPNNGRVVLLVLNAAGANNFTVVTPGTQDGLAITDLVVALTASKYYAIGVFPPQWYNNADGEIAVTVSANADLMPLRVAA